MNILENKKKAVGLIHKVYLSLLKNKRKYLASTKTKSEVRGGGRKPWKQKGTGQARAGSIRSPLWKGGGVAFGPKFRIVKKKINKKENKIAILSSLYLKRKEIISIKSQELNFENIKTKNIITLLKKYNISDKRKTLIIASEISSNLKLSCQNIYFTYLALADSLNLEQILNAKKIIITNEALDKIQSNYGKFLY